MFLSLLSEQGKEHFIVGIVHDDNDVACMALRDEGLVINHDILSLL